MDYSLQDIDRALEAIKIFIFHEQIDLLLTASGIIGIAISGS